MISTGIIVSISSAMDLNSNVKMICLGLVLAVIFLSIIIVRNALIADFNDDQWVFRYLLPRYWGSLLGSPRCNRGLL